MTQDLKDHVLLRKDVAQAILGILQVHCHSHTGFEQQELLKAFNQDLSGMVVVPIEPTEEMCRAGQKHMPRDDLGYVIVDAEYIYAAMLSAAQKEKNDD